MTPRRPSPAAGDDNTPLELGGKRGDLAFMWKDATGLVLGQQTCASETKTAGEDKGKAKVLFSTSVIAGDNYKLKAACKNASGVVQMDAVSGVWSVRKEVKFTNGYQMVGGVDIAEVMKKDNIDPVFSGDGYTDYFLGPILPAPEGASPEFVADLWEPSPLVDPETGEPNPDTELPTAQELADYLNAVLWKDDINVPPFDDFPGPGDTDLNGDKIQNGALVPDYVTRNFAKAEITKKAQKWHDKNVRFISDSMIALLNEMGATGPAVVGARYIHPKHDGRLSPTEFYPPGITIKNMHGETVDPDDDWSDGFMGLHHPATGSVWIFLNSAGNPVRTGRHETGHASDHVSFGAGDHSTSGLMTLRGDGTEFTPTDILRLRGVKR